MRCVLLLGVPLLAGCAYSADVPVSPAYDVARSYGAKIPGKWLLYVEADKLDRDTKSGQFACSAHRYPIRAAEAFRASTVASIGNQVEAVESVQSPPDAKTAAAMGARGVIIVRAEDVRPRLDVKPGFMMAHLEGTAVVIATITVNGRQGRLLGQTVEGSGFATAEAGMACEGGGKALGEAVSVAMGDAMRELAEALANSERVRALPS